MGGVLAMPISPHNRAFLESGYDVTSSTPFVNYTTVAPYSFNMEIRADIGPNVEDDSSEHQIVVGLSSALGALLFLFSGSCVIYFK